MLYVCYVLKQPAEKFAAFRKKVFAPDPGKKDVKPNNFLKLDGSAIPPIFGCFMKKTKV